MKTFLKVWLGVSFIAIGIGIGILIITFASGASWETFSKAADFTTMNKNYEGVESLDLDIGYGNVRVEEGDSFNISAKNILEGELDSYVKDGTWYIREDDSRYNKLFGMRKFIYWDWSDHFAPAITITIPKGFEADRCNITVGAGDVKADRILAAEGNFRVDAGELDIDQLAIAEKSYYKVGAGEMILKEVTAENITVDCGVGNFEINGAITGNNDIKCGIGEVDLNIDGKEDDYSYDVTCGIGDVDIDGDSYKGLGHDLANNSDADNSLHLDCGIGNISVDFN